MYLDRMRIAKYLLFISKIFLIEHEANRLSGAPLRLDHHGWLGLLCKERSELGLLQVKDFTSPRLGVLDNQLIKRSCNEWTVRLRSGSITQASIAKMTWPNTWAKFRFLKQKLAALNWAGHREIVSHFETRTPPDFSPPSSWAGPFFPPSWFFTCWWKRQILSPSHIYIVYQLFDILRFD